MLNRLRVWLTVFFLALAVPSAVLIYQAYGQVQWETFHQHRVMAEELSSRIDQALDSMTETEESRSFTDYSFLVVTGDASANFLQRSPLATYPPSSSVPGLVAYFQVDADGAFSTPLLPTSDVDRAILGISDKEFRSRLALGRRVYTLLSEQNLALRDVASEPLTLPEYPASTQSLAASTVYQAEDAAVSEEVAAPLEEVALQRVADTQLAFDELQTIARKRERTQKKLASAKQSLGRDR